MELNDVRQSLVHHIRRLPGEGRMVFDGYRRIALLKRIARTKLGSIRNPGLPDPEAVYWIDPARVVRHTDYRRAGAPQPVEDRVFHPQRDRGAVREGEWDTGGHAFADLAVVRALQQRIRDRVDWCDTPFHQELLARLRRGERAPWNIRTRADLEARCRYLDQLIDSIHANGYQRNYHRPLQGEDKGLQWHPRFGSEITVNIGRTGEYLFQDGRHRLAIAQSLGLARVPVKVLVRHSQWVQFREFVRCLAHGEGGSSGAGLRQNPVHPDLQDIPAADGCEERFAVIRSALGGDGGTLLDIGANLGYFCHRFEALGLDCYAVERAPQVAQAAERIRIAEGRRFTVLAADVLAATGRWPLRERRFDVVLALGVLHRFLTGADRSELFRRWLRALQVRTMIVEPPHRAEPRMNGAGANFNEQELIGFVLAHSALRHCRLLHRCRDGQPIYQLWC